MGLEGSADRVMCRSALVERSCTSRAKGRTICFLESHLGLLEFTGLGACPTAQDSRRSRLASALALVPVEFVRS